MTRLQRAAGFLLGAALVLLSGWVVLSALWSPALPEPWKKPFAFLAALSLLAAVLPHRYRGSCQLVSGVVIAVFLVMWSRLRPSNDRMWTEDVARMPWAEVRGDVVTLHDVRNFKYRTEADFDANYETRTVKLSELSEVDFVASYWAGKTIAHIMVTFGFANKDFLAFSIETRKEQGESYSPIAGFFRNYELIYVVADERDLLGVRTTYRNPPEDVYVLRTAAPLENGRKLFLQYATKMNELRDKPSFYNTLTTNCTTQILQLVQTFSSRARYNWKILLSGYVPEMLYENGSLAPGYSFDDLLKRSRINDRSRPELSAEEYSRAIREGIPKPEPGARKADS